MVIQIDLLVYKAICIVVFNSQLTMSTIRIDGKHSELLDKLLAHLLLRGKKTTKKELVGIIIENALKNEGISMNDATIPPEDDPAWKGMEETFQTGIKDLSTKVDEYLYGTNSDD
jgi:hypothetical protein